MDRLKKYENKINVIDKKMVRLLEQRMSIVARASEYKWRRGIKTPKEKKDENIVNKAAALACGIDLVEYTEGLIKYMEDIALKYGNKIKKELDWKKKYKKL